MKKIIYKILVNSITSLRIVGTIWLPLLSDKLDAQKLVIIIILLLLTDTIDGLLARRLEVSTLLGSLLDAFADKILGIGILLVITKYYSIMLLPILTEVIILSINVIAGIKGSSIDSSKLGKFKTFVNGLCTVIAFLVIYAKDFIILFDNTTVLGIKIINIFYDMLSYPNQIINSLSFVSFGAGLMVAFDYYLRAKKEISYSKSKKIELKKYKLKKGKELRYALLDTDYYESTKHLSVRMRLGSMEEK